jgi:hypothetical protein
MPLLKTRFNRLLLLALCLLLLSGTVTLFILVNSASVVAADMIFSDIALDHPVYQACYRLVKIGAVRPRAGMSLAPYEKITAADWNFALDKISEHSGRIIPDSVRFNNEREVDAEAIQARIRRFVPGLNFMSVQDLSRISVFYLLDRCLSGDIK